jgi:hypothetical protein
MADSTFHSNILSAPPTSLGEALVAARTALKASIFSRIERGAEGTMVTELSEACWGSWC